MLDNLGDLVVKEVHGSGGYGMLIGPAATKATIEAFRDKLKREPEGFHRPADAGAVDLPDLHRVRPRAAPCRSQAVRADGKQARHHRAGRLTRVALKEGSLVVNSSQGGGTKDTWILDE